MFDPTKRRTIMCYIGLHVPGEIYKHAETRLFIGTRAEIEDEIREEVKTLYPDDYDRISPKNWISHWFDLFLSVDKRCGIPVWDPIGGRRIIRAELYGPWKEEDDV